RWLHRIPTPRNRHFIKAFKRLHRVADRLLTDRRANAADHDDLLSTLLTPDEETGQVMSDQQIHDEIMTFIVAGGDTAAVTMSWALHLIGNHPEIESKIHVELRRVLGERPITHANLAQLHYLRSVVTETLRLYSPAWLLPRCAYIPFGAGTRQCIGDTFAITEVMADHSTSPDPPKA
ncbi:MAG: cytochrome P450, partial [Pseudonocardiaceae bacterium]